MKKKSYIDLLDLWSKIGDGKKTVQFAMWCDKLDFPHSLKGGESDQNWGFFLRKTELFSFFKIFLNMYSPPKNLLNWLLPKIHLVSALQNDV